MQGKSCLGLPWVDSKMISVHMHFHFKERSKEVEIEIIQLPVVSLSIFPPTDYFKNVFCYPLLILSSPYYGKNI